MTQPSHLGIVWNPTKATRDELDPALAAARAATGADPQVTWHETAPDDPGRAAARAALDAGADVVVAVGGDGTVRAVAHALGESESDAALAIIPRGTGNLLARNLAVPLSDIAAAFERALTEKPRPLDLGWVDTEAGGETHTNAFAVMAGFGIDAHMITETDDDLKSRAGWLAYVESLGRAVEASELIHFDVDRDGKESSEEAHTVIVGNCGTLQGGIELLPNADPADGKLDLLMLDAEGISGWLDTLRTFVWDNGIKRLLTGGDVATSTQSVRHDQFRELELNLSEPRLFEVDGDDLEKTTHVKIRVQPGAIRVR